MNIFELSGKIMLDDNDAKKKIEGIDSSGKKLDGRLGGMIKTAGKWGAALGAAMGAVGAAGLAAAGKFSKQADEIDKASIRLGITTDAYQSLGYAMGQVGVDQGTFERSIGRLNQRMGQTGEEASKYTQAIENLGVKTKDADGKQRSANEVFVESMEALHNMESASDQAAYAAEIFGTSTARKLMPAIKEGGDAINDLQGEAHDLGMVMGEDAIDAGVKYADTMDTIKNMLNGVFVELMMQVLPSFQKFLDWVIAHMPQIQAVIETVVNVISDVMGWLIGRITDVVKAMISWKDNNGEIINTIRDSIVDFATVAVEVLKNAIDTILAFWDEWGTDILNFTKTAFDGIKQAIGVFVDIIENIVIPIIQTAYEIFQQVFPAVRDIIERVFKIIGDILHEFKYIILDIVYTIKQWMEDNEVLLMLIRVQFMNMVDRITEVLNILVSVVEWVWDKILNIWHKYGEFIMSFTKTAFDTIANTVRSVLDMINGVLDVFIGIFTGDWERMWDGMQSVVKGAANGIIGLVNGIIGAVESMVGALGRGVNAIPKFEIPSWVPGIGGRSFGIPTIPSPSFPRIPQLDTGTNKVLSDGLAMIHKGETIVPAKHSGKYQEGSGSINLNIDLDGRQIMRALRVPMTKEIRLATGMKL